MVGIVLHDLLLGQVHPELKEGDLQGIDLHRIPGECDPETLASILSHADQQSAAGETVISFCSLDVARLIRRKYPNLSAGLLCDLEKLKWHRYTSLIEASDLLNGKAILLPFGRITDSRKNLDWLFGDRVFLRPNRADKPFPGMVISLEEVEREISGLRQVYHVDPCELVIIAPAQDIEPTEYRFWCVEGQIISAASYAFGSDHANLPKPPEAARMLAEKIALRLEAHENALTVDVVMTDQGAKLVEVNGYSTSGFYPDADLPAIFRAAAGLYF